MSLPKYENPIIFDNTQIKTGEKLINLLESMIYKKPVQISFFTNNLIYKVTKNKCSECSKNSEYIYNDKTYCWHHAQIINY